MAKKKVTEPKVKKIPELNEQQRMFAEHYAAHLNATQAAKHAGYSEKTAYSNGPRLLKVAEVRAYIDQLLAERTIGPKEILARLTEQATFDISSITDDKGNIDFELAKANGVTRNIKSIKRTISKRGDEHTEFELYDAQAALVHLGRAAALFTDKQEHSGIVTWQQVILEAKGASDDNNSYA